MDNPTLCSKLTPETFLFPFIGILLWFFCLTAVHPPTAALGYFPNQEKRHHWRLTRHNCNDKEEAELIPIMQSSTRHRVIPGC